LFRLQILFGLQEFLRLGLEPLAATPRAEEIVLPLMGKTMLRGRRVHAHAADRIDRGRHGGGAVRITMFAAAAGISVSPCMGMSAMVVAGISRSQAVCVIPIRRRHRNSPGVT